MIIKKKVSVGGEFAKKGEDIKQGDVVTIANEGQTIEGQYGEQFVVLITTRNGDRNVNFNQTTQNILHDVFGEDTATWVGKEVTVRMKKDTVANRKVDIYYFVTPEWDFDDYNDLVESSDGVDGDAEEVNPEDAPF